MSFELKKTKYIDMDRGVEVEMEKRGNRFKAVRRIRKEDGSIEVVESMVEGTFIHVCFHLKDVDECFDREELEKLFEQSDADMAKFEILYKMPTFKLVGGSMKAATLVVVRLYNNVVASILIPLPEHLVTEKEVEEELRKRKLI